MSLLMEALRKAEEEKRKAQALATPPASASAASAGPPRENALEPTLEPLVATNRDRAEPAGLTDPGERSDEQLRAALALGSGRDNWRSMAGNESTSPTMERAVVVGAHTVFAAHGNRGGNVTYRIVLGGVLALFVIVAGAAYYYYSLQLTPVAPPVPMAAIAAVPGPPRSPAQPLAQPSPTLALPKAPAAAVPSAPVTRDNPLRPAPEPARAAAPPAAPIAPVPEVETTPRLLRVSRRTAPAALDGNLVEGYNALQREDLATARAAYLAALRNDASSRDALLGLAAIAVREGNNPQALSWYREQLRQNPSDAIAIAGLAALGGDDAETGESELRQLLALQPGSAPLHFTLGRRLAREQRWPEAQQQFFAAFSAAAEQADYAFNLAVSLDHLGQSAAALDHYRKALALAAVGGPATFDAAATRARIDALAAAAEP